MFALEDELAASELGEETALENRRAVDAAGEPLANLRQSRSGEVDAPSGRVSGRPLRHLRLYLASASFRVTVPAGVSIR
jgi:hypothetical protein